MLTKNDRRYCVYTLRYRGIPFYIGKGLYNRPKKHYTPAERRKNHPKNDFINNFDTYITIERDGLTNEEANAFEKQLIEVWGFENLTNKTHGGSGTDGCIPSPEKRAKISKSRRGKKDTAETKARKSEAMRGEKHPMFGESHTPETRKKQSEANSGEKNPNYGDTAHNFRHKDGRKFFQNFAFESLKQVFKTRGRILKESTCTQWELRTKYNLHQSALSEVLSGKGRRKSTGGWSSF